MTTAVNEGLHVLVAELAALQVQLRRIYIRWCVSGPTLEASSALAAMAQEEAGHARVLTRLAGGAVGRADAEAVVAADQVTDWPTLVGHAGPVEIALAGLTGGLRGLDESEFRRNLAKIAVEKRYHADFFLGCYQDLEAGEGRATELFRAARSATEERLTQWLDASTELLAELGLEVRPDQADGSVLDVRCLHCGSGDTRLLSAFGGSLMTSLMRCNACETQFEAVRWR